MDDMHAAKASGKKEYNALDCSRSLNCKEYQIINFEFSSVSGRNLIWVCGGSLDDRLDAATYLDTTREIRKMGWQVNLVVSGPPILRTIRGVEVYCIQVPEKYFVWHFIFHLKLLFKIIKMRTAPDFILFHQISAVWLLPLRFIRRLIGKAQTQLVMDTRSVHMPPKKKEGMKGHLRRIYFRLMQVAANRLADGQTAITEHMAAVVKIPSQKLLGTWPSGVNIEKFSSAMKSRSWPCGNDPVHLIYIGTFDHERNLIKLCRAVEKANSEGMFFKLSLVGDGTDRRRLEHFAHKTQERVRVIPPIPHQRIPQILSQAHIGVLPFPDEEKFRVSSPIKLFEYMAAGLVILATRIFCHTNVIGERKYAFWAEGSEVIELFHSLELVWQNRPGLSAMGRDAADAAKEWSWEKSARKLTKSLKSVQVDNN
jgi:glycosyltransferase involved in cell wall biosynthesis